MPANTGKIYEQLVVICFMLAALACIVLIPNQSAVQPSTEITLTSTPLIPIRLMITPSSTILTAHQTVVENLRIDTNGTTVTQLHAIISYSPNMLTFISGSINSSFCPNQKPSIVTQLGKITIDCPIFSNAAKEQVITFGSLTFTSASLGTSFIAFEPSSQATQLSNSLVNPVRFRYPASVTVTRK